MRWAAGTGENAAHNPGVSPADLHLRQVLAAMAGAAVQPREDQTAAAAALVVSPLLALMRDQVSAAALAGLRAATVNSTNLDDWDAVFDDIAVDRLDVLLVSPDRLGNAGFARRLPGLVAATGLVVIDKAPLRLRLGFDFRRDYQRFAVTALVPYASLLASVSSTSLVFLAVLGFISARAGGASVLAGAWRVTFWGALAMAITAGAGALFGAVA